MKKFRAFFVLFIGLLMMVCASTFAQTNKQAEVTLGGQKPAEKTTQAAETVKTEEVAQKAETQKATTATVTATETKEKSSEEPEEQKIIIFTLAPVVELEICGVRLSLVIEPAYGYPYGGWNRFWYGRPWWWPSGYYGWWLGGYHGSWNNPWAWNNSGRGQRPANYSQPIHASRLKDPHQNTGIAKPNPTNPILTAQSQANQVKSYPSRKSITRNTQQKFNGRISTRYAEPKQSRLFQKATPSTRPTANSRSILSRTQNARSSTPRISNQSRPAFSRTTLRPNLSRTGSSRISSPTRSSAPRSTAVRSSGASRSSAARTSAPRASSSRGGAVRRK